MNLYYRMVITVEIDATAMTAIGAMTTTIAGTIVATVMDAVAESRLGLSQIPSTEREREML